MSWRKYSGGIVWHRIWKGLWTHEPVADMPAIPNKGTFLAQANNVYAPGDSSIIKKVPGFTQVRSTAIHASGEFTGIIHQGSIADRTILGVTDGTNHKLYEDDGNPPTEITGGANPTEGEDNLLDFCHMVDSAGAAGTLISSRQRDTLQFVDGSGTRSSKTVAGTGVTSLKPKYLEAMRGRALFGNVDIDGTDFINRVYWSAIRNLESIGDPTTDFESFERKLADDVVGLKVMSDVCFVFGLHAIGTLISTPEASVAFTQQGETLGIGRGAVSHQAIVEALNRVWWFGQNNIHSVDQNFQIRDHADQIIPTIQGLSDARRDISVAGYDEESKLILFCVSDSGDSQNKTGIFLNVQTGAIYFRNISRNSFGLRRVSGDNRLIGGGYSGLFYNEMTGTSGNLDDATAVIDADVFSPRFEVRGKGHRKKIPFVLVEVDPIGSESLTIQFRTDDNTTWVSPTGSPYSVSGTDDSILFVPIKAFARRIQLRFRNNTADEVYSVRSVGLPADVFQVAA